MSKTQKEIQEDKKLEPKNSTKNEENRKKLVCRHCGSVIGYGHTRCVCGVWVG